jgi:hypothetical protein
MMLVEHRWAARLQDAILGAHGEFVVSEHIPRDVVEVALAAAATPV